MIEKVLLVLGGIVVLVFMMAAFMVDGYTICEKHYKHKVFPEVGIKDIVECNNACSNWYEIIWLDGKTTRGIRYDCK